MVRSPDRVFIPLSAAATLLDATALAGGFRDVTDHSRAYVFRDMGGSKLVANYNAEHIRSRRLAVIA